MECDKRDDQPGDGVQGEEDDTPHSAGISFKEGYHSIAPPLNYVHAELVAGHHASCDEREDIASFRSP